jgi:CheY-like chemotaxis protein
VLDGLTVLVADDEVDTGTAVAQLVAGTGAREAGMRHPDLTIVLMTAYADSPEVTSGEFDVVRKPVSSGSLLQAIRRARARRSRHAARGEASPA